jgi:chemotaxis protein methyltransferase CheR
MDFSHEFEIGIVEYRNIIKVIKDTYGYDFTDYALTSLKRKFEQAIQMHRLRHTDDLIDKLREDKVFFNIFLQEISFESTEMFRDPSFWRCMRDDILPSLIKENYSKKIWLPSCVSGEELYSLAILLKESGWEGSFEIIASCLNDLIIERIKKGSFKLTKTEVSSDNYERFQGSASFSDYVKLNGEQVIRESSLIKNVQFIKQNINFDNSPQDVKLIIYRNRLIYFTQSLHDRVLKGFHESMVPGGMLVLGIKEQVGSISSKYFRLINVEESVYKKI